MDLSLLVRIIGVVIILIVIVGIAYAILPRDDLELCGRCSCENATGTTRCFHGLLCGDCYEQGGGGP